MEGIVISRFMNDIDEYYIGKEKYKAKYYLKYDEMKSHGIKICSNFSNYDKDKILFEFENTRIYATFARMYKTSISMTSIKSLIDENKYKFIKFYIKDDIFYVVVNISEDFCFDNTLSHFFVYIKKKKEFENYVKSKGHTLMSTYITAHDNVYINYNCGHKAHALSPNSYYHGTGCPICSNRKINIGENDIYHTRKDLVKYFINESDAKKYTQHSNVKMLFMCPNCGFKKRYSINNLSLYGFSCPICSDGISYPNKFMANLLSELKINFENEKEFDWCKFQNIYSNKIIKGRYDFFIDKYNLIIEMDGLLGHGNSTKNRTAEETIYIDNQKDNLAYKNGYDLIRIKCDYLSYMDRCSFIKKSILSSDLVKYFDFSKVNWIKIHNNSIQSYMLLAIKLYNENKNYCAKDIANILKLSTATVSKYLKEGNKYGLCKYDDEIIYEYRKDRLINVIGKKVKLVNNTEVLYFNSKSEAGRYFNKNFLTVRKDGTFHYNGIVYDVIFES